MGYVIYCKLRVRGLYIVEVDTDVNIVGGTLTHGDDVTTLKTVSDHPTSFIQSENIKMIAVESVPPPQPRKNPPSIKKKDSIKKKAPIDVSTKPPNETVRSKSSSEYDRLLPMGTSASTFTGASSKLAQRGSSETERVVSSEGASDYSSGLASHKNQLNTSVQASMASSAERIVSSSNEKLTNTSVQASMASSAERIVSSSNEKLTYNDIKYRLKENRSKGITTSQLRDSVLPGHSVNGIDEQQVIAGPSNLARQQAKSVTYDYLTHNDVKSIYSRISVKPEDSISNVGLYSGLELFRIEEERRKVKTSPPKSIYKRSSSYGTQSDITGVSSKTGSRVSFILGPDHDDRKYSLGDTKRMRIKKSHSGKSSSRSHSPNKTVQSIDENTLVPPKDVDSDIVSTRTPIPLVTNNTALAASYKKRRKKRRSKLQADTASEPHNVENERISVSHEKSPPKSLSEDLKISFAENVQTEKAKIDTSKTSLAAEREEQVQQKIEGQSVEYYGAKSVPTYTNIATLKESEPNEHAAEKRDTKNKFGKLLRMIKPRKKDDNKSSDSDASTEDEFSSSTRADAKNDQAEPLGKPPAPVPAPSIVYSNINSDLTQPSTVTLNKTEDVTTTLGTSRYDTSSYETTSLLTSTVNKTSKNDETSTYDNTTSYDDTSTFDQTSTYENTSAIDNKAINRSTGITTSSYGTTSLTTSVSKTLDSIYENEESIDDTSGTRSKTDRAEKTYENSSQLESTMKTLTINIEPKALETVIDEKPKPKKITLKARILNKLRKPKRAKVKEEEARDINEPYRNLASYKASTVSDSCTDPEFASSDEDYTVSDTTVRGFLKEHPSPVYFTDNIDIKLQRDRLDKIATSTSSSHSSSSSSSETSSYDSSEKSSSSEYTETTSNTTSSSSYYTSSSSHTDTTSAGEKDTVPPGEKNSTSRQEKDTISTEESSSTYESETGRSMRTSVVSGVTLKSLDSYTADDFKEKS